MHANKCTFKNQQKCANMQNKRSQFILFLEAGTRHLNSCIEKYPEGGPRAHICKLCGKVSSDRSNLRKHVESIHYPNAFLHACKHCGQHFNTKNLLYMHVKISHKNQQNKCYSCPSSELFDFQVDHSISMSTLRKSPVGDSTVVLCVAKKGLTEGT